VGEPEPVYFSGAGVEAANCDAAPAPAPFVFHLYSRGSRFLNRDLSHCAIMFIKNVLLKNITF
jgi:hypothetical protein